MDGYIKNKKEAIASVRRGILGCYSITFIILVFIPLWLFIMAANQPPEKWTHTNIVFSHISKESIGMQRGKSDVLNTQDGRKFVINGKLAKEQDLSKNLIPGNSYRIVYSNTIAGGDHIVALSNNDTVFQALDASIAKWQKEQKEMIVAIFITLIVEVIALILIDRIGCRKLHAEIAKLKADIKRREAKIRGE